MKINPTRTQSTLALADCVRVFSSFFFFVSSFDLVDCLGNKSPSSKETYKKMTKYEVRLNDKYR